MFLRKHVVFILALCVVLTGCVSVTRSSLQPQPAPQPQTSPSPQPTPLPTPQPTPPPGSADVLYIQNDLDPQIFAFDINPADGSLTPVAGSPFTVPTNVRRVFGAEKYLLAARFGGFPGEPVGLYEIPIQIDGSLITSQETLSLPNVISVAFGEGNFIYTLEGAPRITQRTFDVPTGTFSQPFSATSCMPHVSSNACDEVLGASPDKQTLWLGGNTCTPSQCTAMLTAVPLEQGMVAFPATTRSAFAGSFTDPVLLNNGIVSVAFDGFDSNSSVTFWSTDGQLLQSCGATDSTGCAQAWSVASDPQRRFLFIGTLDGKLSSAPLTAFGFSPQNVRTSVVSGLRPDKMVVNSSGEFLYVQDSLSNSVTGFRIGPDGSLSAIPGSFNVSGPGAASTGRMGTAVIVSLLPAR